MIRKVNRNFIWTKIFAEQLVRCGVKYVCISPGSRCAPLTYAFAENKKFKCFVNIDERSSAFVALGLAKASGSPVVVITTSGTATAELYPAIIEAYQQRTPLIICTADRPPELRNTGANQMINQKNIYRNHIRWFKDVGLPELNVKKLLRLKRIAQKSFEIAATIDKGPVHLNFPFRKPLEPDSFTDEFDDSILDSLSISASELKDKTLSKREKKIILKTALRISKAQKGLIIAGPEDFNPELQRSISMLSSETGFPLLADGLSQLRNDSSSGLIITNYDAFLRTESFRQKFQPDLILHFGRTSTSAILENYVDESSAEKFIINEYGDRFESVEKAGKIISMNPAVFCNEIIRYLNEMNFRIRTNDWSGIFLKSENLVEKIKSKITYKAAFAKESGIIPQIINSIPENTSIMFGNSLPVRDHDWFTGKTDKKLKIYFNRGASGIDGITSTAIGIARHYKAALLVTGDLSFLHDINSIISAKRIQVSLVIVLINNNGGGIFDSLPISANVKFFRDYFKIPHNLNIKNLVESTGHNYIFIEDWNHFASSIKTALNQKAITVLEIKTDSRKSLQLRKKYWNAVIEKINSEFT